MQGPLVQTPAGAGACASGSRDTGVLAVVGQSVKGPPICLANSSCASCNRRRRRPQKHMRWLCGVRGLVSDVLRQLGQQRPVQRATAAAATEAEVWRTAGVLFVGYFKG